MGSGNYGQGNYRGFTFFPPVLKNLLIINGVIYFLTNVMGAGFEVRNRVLELFALLPIGFGFQVWQLLTYQFLHANFSHILFNMFALWMFGMEVEQEMGSRKFLIFYLVSGIGGGIAQVLATYFFPSIFPPVEAGHIIPTIGASGAIFGVLIAFGLLYPNRYIMIYFLIPVKAKYLIMFMIVTNVLAIGDGSGVAHIAHVAGGVTGFLFMLLDKNIHFDFKGLFQMRNRRMDPFRNQNQYYTPPPEPPRGYQQQDYNSVQDAHYTDINDIDEITQADIDAILDKISRDGYKNLSDKEKRILFEASKRMNK
jgi:membrane associated rhomboid family serine protease